jgi:biotin carboxyl carrier protein
VAKIVIDGVSREVTVERGQDGMVVTVDGRRHAVRDVSGSRDAVAFLLDSKSHVALVSVGAGRTRISLDGSIYVRSEARLDADAPALAAGAGGNGRLEAPMPGAIIALHVHAGDQVTAGQPVVVLESMKMHNEIASPINGVVRRVNCKVGDQVSYGHVLAEIAAE